MLYSTLMHILRGICTQFEPSGIVTIQFCAPPGFKPGVDNTSSTETLSADDRQTLRNMQRQDPQGEEQTDENFNPAPKPDASPDYGTYSPRNNE